MVAMIYAMLVVALLVIVLAVVALVKRKGTLAATNAEQYDVFSVAGSQLTVLAGIPVAYEIDDIANITFAVTVGRHRHYQGVMRVVKANGAKSRPFLFDGSAYTKRFMPISSKQDIEQAIGYLMDELGRYHIRCSRKY